MAEFVQTMKNWKRMCNAMGQEDEYTACDKCDLRGFDCPAIYEKECDSADWKRVENVVAKWAAKHPEPVYPTWAEWLYAQGLMTDVIDGKGGNFLYNLASESIPADIAQKLGVQPKEDKPKKRTKDMVCGNDYCELE